MDGRLSILKHQLGRIQIPILVRACILCQEYSRSEVLMTSHNIHMWGSLTTRMSLYKVCEFPTHPTIYYIVLCYIAHCI